jgi:hypothetical protein
MEELIEYDLEDIRVRIDLKNLEDQLNEAASVWDIDSPADGGVFWKDVFRLAYDFLHFSDRKEGILHLKTVCDNGCSKFHTDGYALRLFTTYWGEGTEWLPEKAVNRSGLGKSNEKIVRDESQIQRMQTFEVGLLKGELHNRSATSIGIVHRSPPIEESQECRIILRIDI